MEDADATALDLNQALPLLRRLAGTTIVIKIGGSTLGAEDTTLEDVVHLTQQGARVVLVHGGGATISHWLSRVGQQAHFVDGLRVTDTETMEVVTMVLAGKVNKELVAGIQSHGGQAVGLCGVDGGLLCARPKDPNLGLVGEVTAVNTAVLNPILRAGFVPVIAPIALGQGAQILNLNADTAAAEVAVSLGCEKLVFLTDVPGIRDESGAPLPRLSPDEANRLIADGVISGGMIPKAQACLRALDQVSAAHIVDGRTPRALLRELLAHTTVGTMIVKE